MATHGHPSYMTIFYWLAILTVGEIGATFLPLSNVLIGILLVGFAVTKAALVAMYFMHLRFEKGTLAIIAATPMFLCVLLVFALLPDYGGVVHETANKPAAAAPH